MVAAASSEPVGTLDKTVPAYTPPSGPANISHEPIARGEQVALSPTHPLGTVKEGGQ